MSIERGTTFAWFSWGWSEGAEAPATDEQDFHFALQEGSGFLCDAHVRFDSYGYQNYDPARCGAFADWLDEHRDRLLEPHTVERAEAEERLDSLIKWLRSGLQISA